MARYWKLLLCTMVVMAVQFAAAQSLGDVARQERGKQKPQAARIYTNEDIPSIDTSKDAAPASDARTDATASTAEVAADGTPDKSPVEKQKELNAEWKKKVAGAKEDVASIEREIDLMQREQRLKAAVFYADAGNKLRDNKQWLDDEQKFQSDLSSRQKGLSAAKAKLEDTREAARKAGATGYE